MAAVTVTAEQLSAAGLALDVDERALVAHWLLDSIRTDVQVAVDAAWDDEIERRLAGVLDGTATLLDGPASHESIRADLAYAHQKRNPGYWADRLP